MLNPTPAAANVRTAKVVARADGSPITTGTVNFYLYQLKGPNAGHWWKAAVTAGWSDTEASAGAMEHVGDGSWIVTVAAAAWEEGAEYLEYWIESGNLHVPVDRHILCGSVFAVLANAAHGGAAATLTLDDFTAEDFSADFVHLKFMEIHNNANENPAVSIWGTVPPGSAVVNVENFDDTATGTSAIALRTNPMDLPLAITERVLDGITSFASWLRGLLRKSAMNEIAKEEVNVGGGTFDEATDSLEAQQEQAASLLTTTVQTATTQTSLILTAGSSVNDAYLGQTVVLTDATNSDYPSIRKVSGYVGATKTIALDAAADFTVAAGDGVRIIAAPRIADTVFSAAALAAGATAILETAVPGSFAAGTVGKALGALGGWTGTGVNTILGAFKALLLKAGVLPSDIGTTMQPSTDSVEALGEKAAYIVPGRLTILSPISLTGRKLELIRGDDYTDAAGQPLEWTDPGTWPDLAAGTTVALTIRDLDTDAVVLTKAGTIAAGPPQKVKFQPTHDLTQPMTVGDEHCGFDVEAVLSDLATRRTLVYGLCSVLQDYTREAT